MGETRATRGHLTEVARPPLALGNLLIDREQYRVTVSGRPVPLTFREFELLHLLAANANRVVHYGHVEERIWGLQGDHMRRRTAVLICRLRKKLAGMRPYRIETVRRVGYRLSPPLGHADRLEEREA